MAKRKKNSKSKKATNKKESDKPKDHALPEGFWSQAFALVLGFIIAPLTVLGLFGVGGSLPVGLYDLARWFFGLGAVFVPLILFVLGVRTFRSEKHRLPTSVYLGMALFLSVVGGLEAVVSDSEDAGGLFGGILGSLTEGVLTGVVAAFVLIIIGLIALLFVLRISVKELLMRLGIIKGTPVAAKEAGEEDVKDRKSVFKLNEGVPIQKSGKLNKKEGREEDQKALTTTTDPNWKLPGLDLLNDQQDQADPGDVKGNAEIIKDTLADFNITVDMEGANVGPKVTQYTLKPSSGVRLTKITSLENNIALNLAAPSIRIEAPIPGKRAVGIEVPNKKSATVRLHSIIDSKQWKAEKSALGFSVGKDIAGNSVVTDLDTMPHVLIAGATGSGKSIMINTLLTSLLYRNSPSDLKLILVDPKQVELKLYDGIPHLLTPVITQPEQCISALKWAVAEMERRYDKLSEAGKRNIAGYNKIKKEEGMPYIVIVIDELADLMMAAARDVEALIVRLAQKSRAVGIHLVLATQRPSVDVITGLIKANIPARIAFTVTSQVDSRTIIDQGGAEKLLGQGDMLFTTPRISKPIRLQGAFIEESEIDSINNHIRMQSAPEYDEEIITQPVQLSGGRGIMASGDPSDDSLYEDSVRCVIESGKASASLLQRRLRVGYARAARLIESMEEQGVIGPADGARPREVLVSSMDDVFGSEESI